MSRPDGTGPLRRALHASVDLPEVAARARDDFLAAELGRGEGDLAETWAAHRPGAPERASAVAMLARRGLVRAALNDVSGRVPAGIAGYLVEAGRWSTKMALAIMRNPNRGFAPETLASLAPWLDAEESRGALAVVAERPGISDPEDAKGVAAVVARLVALEGPAAAGPALAPFSPAIRALVAALSWRTWPRELRPLAARAVAEGAHEVQHCSQAAGVAFASLPLFDEPDRSAIVRRALDRVDAEDFGLDCEHAALLGAVGLWSYGWEDALGHSLSLPYPRAQMLAQVVPHLPPERRAEGYALWLEAHAAALEQHGWGLDVPRGLPEQAFHNLIWRARASRTAEGRAFLLVALAHQRGAIVPEALAAVRALSGAHGAAARLSILPVVGEADRLPLAAESEDAMIALLEAGRESELRSAAQRWPRGPDEQLWCYLSDWNRTRALLAAPLAWMPREARCARAEALLERSQQDRGDRSILAAAAAVSAAMPEPRRGAWAGMLGARIGAESIHPVALVAVAALLPEPRRGDLAEAAWRAPRIGRDEEHVTGSALVRASRWMAPARRAAVQVEALERWSVQEQHPYQWTALVRALAEALDPRAVAWLRARPCSEHDAVALLPALPEEARRAEADARVEELSGSTFFWRNMNLLKALYPHASNAGPLMLRAVERWREHGFRAEEDAVSLAIAWALDPIAASGAFDRAEALRRDLDTPLSSCIGDLALARHEARGPAREARIAAALERLPEVASGQWAGEAWEAALRFLPPGQHRRRVLAVAGSLAGSDWLGFALTAQEHGAREELAAQITEARIAAATPEELLRSGLDLGLWVDKLDPAEAFSCWRRFWRDAAVLGRSNVILGGWGTVRALGDMVPVALRAGGPSTAEELAAAVLDVADWFP